MICFKYKMKIRSKKARFGDLKLKSVVSWQKRFKVRPCSRLGAKLYLKNLKLYAFKKFHNKNFEIYIKLFNNYLYVYQRDIDLDNILLFLR